MAKIAVTCTVTCTVVFLLFALACARTPVDLPENDIESHDPSITVPESNTKTILLLPSEKPDTERKTVVEIEPEILNADPVEFKTESIDLDEVDNFSDSEVKSVEIEELDAKPNQPFTVVTFRPRNRHFPHIRSDRQYPYRLHHPCRGHRFHHHFGGGRPRFHGETHEISYGNDMITSKEDNNADEMLHGHKMREIPSRWVRFHHHGRPRFPFMHEKLNKEEMKKTLFHHPHHHHHHHMEEEDEVAEKKHKEGGLNLMKRVRKFLNHF